MEIIQPETDDAPVNQCGICGDPHECSSCSIVETKHRISDNRVLSRARLSLPDTLKIETMSEGSHNILPLETIEEGTRFGPFEAKKQFTLDPGINFPLKVFKTEDYFQEYYLDTSDENECNWMFFVQPASNKEEQNLICYEDNSRIYYISTRKILVGEHLKVWYSPFYCKMMDKSLLEGPRKEEENEVVKEYDVNEMLKKQQNIPERKAWICKFCGKQEDGVLNFAVHVHEHYKMQLSKVCEVCKDTFKTRQSLKKHMFFVHSNDMDALQKSESNKTTSEPVVGDQTKLDVGGPLLNEMLSETLDNNNVLLDHMMLSNFDMDQSNVFDNDLGVESLLNETGDFNFNIAETNEKFVCDICLKNFSKLKLLVLHLAVHMGKFTCRSCLTVFSRKETLLSHGCTGTGVKCEFCNRIFAQKKYLTRHIAVKHTTEFVCTGQCKKVFSSSKTLEEHKCVPDEVLLSCNICQKEFYKSRNLKRHMKVHRPKAVNVVHLCEICSKQYQSKKLLHQHMATHKERQFSCRVCNKSFLRKSYFVDHLEIHKKNLTHACKLCDQKFSLKKYLTNHMVVHDPNFKYSCPECPSKFKQNTNLNTHMTRKHNRKCPNCDEVFKNADGLKQHRAVHYEKCYECPLCRQVVKLKSSFLRHWKKKHPNEEFDLTLLKRVERKINNENTNNEEEKSKESNNACDEIENLLKEKNYPDSMQDIDSNLDYIVNNYDPNNLLDSGFNVNEGMRTENDAVLDFNSLEMEFEKNFNVPESSELNDQEVCLSMPELTDIEQKITLGEKAYILENGTIIEPIEQGKVLLYILEDGQKAP